MVKCNNCGADIPKGHETLLQREKEEDPEITLCPDCVSKIKKSVKAETENINWIGALILGTIAALMSALIWYGFVIMTNYQVGLIAIAVGWIVAQAIVFGAGHKRGIHLQLLSVGMTIIALASSEYLVIRHFSNQILAEEGYTIPLLISPDVMISAVFDSLSADPLTLLFWGIAIWTAFSVPASRSLK
ncbi:MAG: hypothetical protein KAU03_02085 [Candidatus Altiarchaeales archaeon]|nr:hypothetical protein [Candidatus Altiarchaeales archaeon]